MHLLAQYLLSVQEIHGSGAAVKETSFYPALSQLFGAVGKGLKPPVYCVSILKNVGAGFPDGGFFTKAQNQTIDKEADAGKKNALLRNLKPERGVLEVKGVSQDLTALIQSAQVFKYLEEYGLVLVSNLREFALVDLAGGKAREIERFSLCNDALSFWSVSPAKCAEEKGGEFEEFLSRCLLTGAPLRSPQDVAAFLASYARQGRLRLEATDLDTLLPLRTALETALGIEFKALDKPGQKLSETQKREQGERFFRATLVQTLFYGLFSAWLSHVRESSEPFRWREAQYSLHVPMVSTLFEELIKASNLQSLELGALLALAAEMLGRVEKEAFFDKWNGSDAIQYFYEPFLERFDPTLRRELGVYYTPRDIVRYMVARVHRVLQDELGLPDGLADESVMILDPCCGTGAFVLETLRTIAERLAETKPKNQVAGLLKKAAIERVFGFEILPAPFVVAHHGVADLLAAHNTGFKNNERAPIFLTNALTGWASEPNTPLPYLGFEEERQLSQSVKQKNKILVIIGNPPYDAFAKIEEDADLIAPYKKGLRDEWKIKKWSFNDLYLRFFRIAERKLADGPDGQGVLCFISNFSYLREPSFVVMRKHLLGSFDSFWVDVLNGDSRETGKRTPEGLPDPSVFSTPFNREGIKVGTAIGLMVRGKEKSDEKRVNSRELWGDDKREQLLESLAVADFNSQYERAHPAKENRFALRPRNVGNDYNSWPLMTELSEIAPFAGLAEDRRKALMSTEEDVLTKRMQDYFNADISWPKYKQQSVHFVDDYVDFAAEETREKLVKESAFKPSAVVPYVIRPFDVQWCYYTAERPLWRRSRPEFAAQVWNGNQFILTRFKQSKRDEGMPLFATSGLCDYHCLAPNVSAFPLQLRREVADEELDANDKLRPKMQVENGVMRVVTHTETVANLSAGARSYLAALGFTQPDTDAKEASLLWYHALAVGYSRAFREEHAGGLSADWPRVPLPANASDLEASARLGEQVARLLDVARPFEGIETSPFNFQLEPFGALSTFDGKAPEDGDAALRLTENWGFFAERGIVQPGTPRLSQRAPDETESASLVSLGLPPETPVLDLPLHRAADGTLVSWWSGVPRPVWETVIGGYPVLKKWLSYRDERVLGRPMHAKEAAQAESIVRRLVLLWSLAAQLDENYARCVADAYAWNQSAKGEE